MKFNNYVRILVTKNYRQLSARKLGEKFKITLSKAEVRNEVKKIEKSDYFDSLKEQVQKIRSNNFDQKFHGEAEEWKQLIHDTEFQISDVFYDPLIIIPFHAGSSTIDQLPGFLEGKKTEKVIETALKTKKKKEKKEKAAPSEAKNASKSDSSVPCSCL